MCVLGVQTCFRQGKNEKKQADDVLESWLLMEWSSRYLQGGVGDRICHELSLPGMHMEAQWAVLARNVMFTFNDYLYFKMKEGNREF